MASNAGLISEIEALVKELNLADVKTDGLNNNQLAKLASDLKAKKRDAENDTAADEAERRAATAAAAAQPSTKKKPPYYLAPRKSITTKRGILSGDTEDEITEKDLNGGKAALDAFVESGHILKG